MFGNENQGIHKHVLGIAIFDLLITLVAAWLFSQYFRIHFVLAALLLLVLAILIHRLFCVNTTINKLIFGIV